MILNILGLKLENFENKIEKENSNYEDQYDSNNCNWDNFDCNYEKDKNENEDVIESVSNKKDDEFNDNDEDNRLIYLKSDNIFHSKEFSHLENNKIINTLRSQQSLSTNEIKNLPNLLLDMQQALTISNKNVLELRSKLINLINKQKEMNEENNNFKNSIQILKSENKKLQKIKEMNSNNTILLQKLAQENNNVKNDNEDLNHKLNSMNHYIESLKKDFSIVLKENIMLKEIKAKENIKDKKDMEILNDNIEEIQELKSIVLESKKTMSETLISLHEKERENYTYSIENQDLFQKLKFSNEKLRRQEEINNNLLSKIKEYETALKNSNIQHNTLINDLKILSEENKKIKSELNPLKEQINFLEEELKLHKSELNNVDNFIWTNRFKSNSNYNENLYISDKENFEEFRNKKENRIFTLDGILKEKDDLFFELNSLKHFIINLLDSILEYKEVEKIVSEIEYKQTLYEEIRLNCSSIQKSKLLKYSSISVKLSETIRKTLYNNYNHAFNDKKNVYDNKEIKKFKDRMQEYEIMLNDLNEKYNKVTVKYNNESLLRKVLHNKFIQLRGNLRIMCRIRPFLDNEVNTSKLYQLRIKRDSIIQILNKESQNCKLFELDYVFSQERKNYEVYGELSMLTKGIVEGRNFCLISYGQTSTGKTYTIQGTKTENGLIFECIKDIFEILLKLKENSNDNENENSNVNIDYKLNKKSESRISSEKDLNIKLKIKSKDRTRNRSISKENREINSSNIYNMSKTGDSLKYKNEKYPKFDSFENSYKNRKDNLVNDITTDQNHYSIINSYHIYLSIIEIYNDNIYSLLSDNNQALNIYESNDGRINLPDLKLIEIYSLDDAKKLIKIASKLRESKSTRFNSNSSRSHLIYSIVTKIVYTDGRIKESKINFVDLAGSERLSRNKEDISDNLKKELNFIHVSLNSLSNVLNSIATNQNHIPYRDTKLTHYLKDCLTDEFNLILLLHISPNQSDYNETCSTLNFGERIARLCGFKCYKEK